MRFSDPDEIIAMTPQWKGERFADGRPRVPDRCLDALRSMTLEELWKPIFVKGYENQFIAMTALHPEFDGDGEVSCKLIGRAVTAVYGPSRPDYYEASCAQAAADGRSGTPNQWVIDSLQERDVAVVDMYDKIYKGTFLGGNLATAVKTRTVSGGAVIWGGIRDLEQMQAIDGIQVYYRGIDPSPIRDFVMLGFNSPARIGDGEHSALCLPGDVVYGCSGGVLFIPPQLAEEVAENGAKTQIKDLFGFEMITAGRFTTAQIDKNVWTADMLDKLTDFIKSDPRGSEYRRLDWSGEYDLAHGAADAQSAL